LVARYGEKNERLEVGGQSVSSWWREVSRIREGGGGNGGGWFDFEKCIGRKVDNGRDTFIFWTNLWLGGHSLCVWFRCIFDLAENKSNTVAVMCDLGWEEGGAACQWWRHLWAWKKELLWECMILLLNVTLQGNSSDKWQWKLDPEGGYMVRGAYKLLTNQADHTFNAASNLTWHKQVHLKVSIFAWRLLQINRLPTKDNLVARVIIPLDA